MTAEWGGPVVQTAARAGLVCVAVFVLFALHFVPLNIGSLGEIRPFFLLAAVYYWAIVRPTLLPAPAAFLVGLGVDLLSASPLGLHAGVLVGVQWLIRAQRKFLLGQSFLVIWAGFATVVFAAAALEWVVFALFYLESFPLLPVALSAAVLSLLFPLLVLPLARIARLFEARDPANMAYD